MYGTESIKLIHVLLSIYVSLFGTDPEKEELLLFAVCTTSTRWESQITLHSVQWAAVNETVVRSALMQPNCYGMVSNCLLGVRIFPCCIFLCALSKNIFLNLECAFLYPYVQWITMQSQNITRWLVYTLGLISFVFFYNP